jgi:glycosyltransferase involved in cell wall biosynthesis
LIWKLSAWNGTGLKIWIEGNKPDVIFVTPGYSMFVYDIAMKLSKKYNIPIVTYFFDDFHENVQKKNNPVFAVRRYLFRRKTNQLIKVSRQILTISKTMAEEYSMLFNKPCEALMIPYEKSMILPQKNEYKRPYKFVYAGNVGLNRWITLKMLGESIKRINAGGKILTLDIYSSNQDSSIIEALSIGDDVKYRGFVGAYELHDIFEEADILVHVEGFDSESKLRVKHSISTKIPNYLVCGRPILAIGPKDIASTRHFNESNAAYVIADEKIIEDELRRWFVENSIDENIIQNALALAEKEHSVSQNTNRLSKFFDECEDK